MIQASLIFESELTPKKGNKIPKGIYEKAKFTGMDYKPGEYVDLNFEDAEGRYNNKRLWAPKGTYPRKIKDKITGDEREETIAEAIDREEQDAATHVIRLLHIFLGQEALAKFNGSYDEFMTKAAKAFTPSVLSSKFVNIKLIYDAGGIYGVFGNFPDYVEEYVENEPTKLKYSKWELENRCTPADATPTSSVDSTLKDLLKPRQ